MTDRGLVRQDEPSATSASRTRWAILVAVLVCAALIAAAGAWWYIASRAQIPDWERTEQLDFVVPVGDAFRNDAPWVRLQVAPLRAGAESTLRVTLDTTRGTPAAAAEAERTIEGVTVSTLGDEAVAEQLALQPDGSGALVATIRFDHTGWWRLEIQVEESPDGAEFYLLVPDPNINGPNAVPGSPSSTEGEALYQRGVAATSALQSVSFSQWLADGRGNAGVSERSVTAPEGDQPSGLIYRASDGTEIVVIGSTRWVRIRGGERQRQEGAAIIPPAQWAEEFNGATGFTVLGEESVAGRLASLVAFVVPERTEPRRQTVAWYLWWVDTETGHVLQEAMVSRVHYMLNRYDDFDEPLTLVSPEQPATPAPGGTPIG